MTEGPLDTSQHEIKIDLQGLIRLLAKNLYAESDVFVRELVQNAHDSILRRSLQAQLDIIGMVDIYQERMFITSNNRDILPVWAKFVRGVIDSPHFTPTASRDAIQLDAAAREIKEALGEIIMRHLQQMAERDHKKFERIMEWHHHHVKGMAVEYDDFFDAIADLVPFETNKGPMSLRHYCEQMAIQDEDGKSKILYFSESGSATQYYMLCNAKGLGICPWLEQKVGIGI